MTTQQRPVIKRRLISSLRKTRYFFLGAALAAVAALPRAARAQAVPPPKITIDAPHGLVSWTSAVDPSSPTAVVTYNLFSRFGLNVNALVTPSAISSTTQTSLPIGNLGGRLSTSECFVLQSSDTVSGVFATSLNTCHSYLHTPGGGNVNSILRSDALGQQVGFGQVWNLSYFLDDDSYVTLKIYPPGETFTTSVVTGLATPTFNLPETTTVVGGTPRSGETNGGSGGFAQINETWDWRDSSGTTVAKGIYYAYFSVKDSNGTLQYASAATLPVDTIRFLSFSTVGIAAGAANAVASINYGINANCNFRAVIARPGRKFTIDANGDVQSLDATNTVIDKTTASVVAVIVGQRAYGQSLTETWNGTDLLGVAVSTGLYPVGLSATDASGNRALDLSGNNGPVAGSISVNRIPPAAAVGGPGPNVASLSVNGTALNLNGGTSVSAFSVINITLDNQAGNATTVSLQGPNGIVAGGKVTISGTSVVYSTTSVLAATGTYSVSIQAYDPSGVNPGLPKTVPFLVIPTPGPSVTAITVPAPGGTALSLVGGAQPTFGLSSITQITASLSAPGGTNTTFVVSGPFGIVPGGVVTVAGAQVTYSTTAVAFSTAGAYTVTVNPLDATNTNVGPTGNAGFTIAAGGGGGGGGGAGGPAQSNALLAASLRSVPNPVKNGPASIGFTIAADSTVDVDIYTLTGQRVVHSEKRYFTANNPNSYLWNLANDAGSGVANGIYVAHITVSNALGTVKAAKKIMVVK